ncbi:cobalamin biosynthesis protein [Escherichia sp. E4736]|uniref:cobalamin biosynthesis protein n=1 Tax=Escherichia sp. E4736 TaxID=2044466 RepID=UPI001080BAC6|nr:cobalamin biosynthesis protein [Escherichia sp. E4736]TGB67735.1 cobalamin biosynthesis protein [Escherichia coli]TLI94607.1 cobalamin biosynthesis protein [Escherichia sp. E4736]
MKTIKPESIALFCLSSGDIELAKHLAEMLPITCFVGEDWQQGFLPFNGGPEQSLSDAYSDYSVLLLIAESGTLIPERLPLPDGVTVILIAEHNARLLNGTAGGAVALIHYLNEMCQFRETVANDTFCRSLTQGNWAISQCLPHS